MKMLPNPRANKIPQSAPQVNPGNARRNIGTTLSPL
jgi:hypothetical protein